MTTSIIGSAPSCGDSIGASRGWPARLALDLRQNVSGFARFYGGISCHASHRNSRGRGVTVYRNLIKIPRRNAPMPVLCRRSATRLEFIRQAAHIRRNKTDTGETAMSVVPIDERPGAAAGAATRQGLWQRLARMVDQHFADRSRRAVSPLTLRRSRYDVDRCRRLLGKNGLAPAGSSYATISDRRVV
jgi:hypothetical protein